jgi:hypothetical protein
MARLIQVKPWQRQNQTHVIIPLGQFRQLLEAARGQDWERIRIKIEYDQEASNEAQIKVLAVGG